MTSVTSFTTDQLVDLAAPLHQVSFACPTEVAGVPRFWQVSVSTVSCLLPLTYALTWPRLALRYRLVLLSLAVEGALRSWAAYEPTGVHAQYVTSASTAALLLLLGVSVTDYVSASLGALLTLMGPLAAVAADLVSKSGADGSRRWVNSVASVLVVLAYLWGHEVKRGPYPVASSGAALWSLLFHIAGIQTMASDALVAKSSGCAISGYTLGMIFVTISYELLASHLFKASEASKGRSRSRGGDDDSDEAPEHDSITADIDEANIIDTPVKVRGPITRSRSQRTPRKE